jgi:hypothetical protein
MCGSYVQKDAVPTCVEWCSQARACLGEERWQALMGTRDDEAPEAGAGADAVGGAADPTADAHGVAENG